MPKLSVIIPVYNVEDYIKKCLDSVVRPELSEYEIVIVNDGSTDSSPVIAAEYCALHPESCRMISTPNGGLGHARNVGIDAALGDYLMFLDSDDYLSDDALAEMLSIIDGSFDICFFDMVSVNGQGRSLKYIEGFRDCGEISQDAIPQLLLSSPNACNKLYRRELFIKTHIRFPNRVWYEDIRTIPKLYFYAEKCVSVRKAWYNYLQRPESITNSKNISRNTEIIDAFDDLSDFCKCIGVFDKYRDALEFLTLDHQLISATVRVNLIDRKSPLQNRLIDDCLSKYPNCLNNPYVPSLSFNRRLVLSLCVRKHFLMLNLLMRTNNLVRRKNL